MTPEELQAIRARQAVAAEQISHIRGMLHERHVIQEDVPALCDALEAAWAERDAARARIEEVIQDIQENWPDRY